MLVLRQTVLLRRTASLAVLAAAAACGSDRLEYSAVNEPLPPLGPDRLNLSLSLAPSVVSEGQAFSAFAVARNQTDRPIAARLACASGGLAIHVVDAQGQVVRSTPTCPSGSSARTVTLQPGDTVFTALSASGPAGSFTVQAVYEAVDTRSSVGEVPLMILPAAGPQTPGAPCTTSIVFGLYVGVTDARTGALVPGAGVVATDGAYRIGLAPGPSVPGMPAGVFYGAEERAGTYSVTVTAPGYKEWTRDGITVAAGACHVTPTFVTAALEPNG